MGNIRTQTADQEGCGEVSTHYYVEFLTTGEYCTSGIVNYSKYVEGLLLNNTSEYSLRSIFLYILNKLVVHVVGYELF
jgi:hypothetical protein